MTQLTCTCLLSVQVIGNNRIETRCGQVFQVTSTWSHGSYCGEYCATHDLEARLPSEAGTDMQTPDEYFGINAFRVQPRQVGAFEDRDHQSDG